MLLPTNSERSGRRTKGLYRNFFTGWTGVYEGTIEIEVSFLCGSVSLVFCCLDDFLAWFAAEDTWSDCFCALALFFSC